MDRERLWNFFAIAGLLIWSSLACQNTVASSANVSSTVGTLHRSSSLVKTDYVEAELISSQKTISPNDTFYVALRLKMAEHWHTYWRNPGDSGLPTTIQWTLPAGFTAGPILWPVPQKIPFPPLASYGYENEVLLPVAIKPPSTFSHQELTLHARADWLVCKDVCLPDGADLSLTLGTQPATSDADPQWGKAIQTTLSQLPQPLPLNSHSAKETLKIEGLHDQASGKTTLTILTKNPLAPAPKLEFFPYEIGKIEASAPQTIASYQRGWALTLAKSIESPNTGSTDQRLAGILVGSDPIRTGKDALWAYEIDLPIAQVSTAELTAIQEKNLGSLLPGSTITPYNITNNRFTFTAWFIALTGAFLGGLILNLMPCVFPILSLKLLHFAQSGDHGPKTRYQHAVAYLIGVVSCFIGLAITVLSFRNAGESIGWGFQLQEPGIITGLTLLSFALALNLCGVYEIVFPNRLMNALPFNKNEPNTQIHPIWQAFGSGVLAVIVASPCTAPFMGSAVGFAITQSYVSALTIFAAMGLGMALPYVTIVIYPRLLGWLPRPGPWMQRLKTLLAFPLFATVVWLLWILGLINNVDAVARLGFSLTLLSLGLWLWGQHQQGAKRLAWVSWIVLAAAFVVTLPLWKLATPNNPIPPIESAATPDATRAETSYQPFSPQALSNALAQGQTVFVDFTAAWCITCQANKRLVLEQTEIQAAFQGKNIATLRADWTKRNPSITKTLNELGRSSVPTYALYRPNQAPILLPEILTKRIVLQALEALQNPS